LGLIVFESKNGYSHDRPSSLALDFLSREQIWRIGYAVATTVHQAGRLPGSNPSGASHPNGRTHRPRSERLSVRIAASLYRHSFERRQHVHRHVGRAAIGHRKRDTIQQSN
jgi:hypothetical protein